MNLCASYQLSKAESEVLERGLTFIPTPTSFNKLELRKDLHDYHRRIKILDNFPHNFRLFTFTVYQPINVGTGQ